MLGDLKDLAWDIVKNPRRDPPLSVYVWGLWMKVPALLWIASFALDIYVIQISLSVH